MADMKREIWVVDYEDGTHTWFAMERLAREAASANEGAVTRFVPAESPQPKAQGDGWVPFDISDPNGPDIEDGTPAWIVWKGTVQHQPWIWDHSEVVGPAWLVTGTGDEPDRVVHGVTHYMPLKPPAKPEVP